MAGLVKVRARVRGERVVRKNLDGLAKDLDGRDMSDALLAGARVYAKKMRGLAPKRTKVLANSIYAFNSYRSDFPGGKGARRVRIKLRKNEAMAVASSSVAHMMEFGTKPHRIRPRRRKALAFSGAIVGGVNHPGAKPHPFWRPALYNGASEATQAVVVAAQAIVEKYD